MNNLKKIYLIIAIVVVLTLPSFVSAKNENAGNDTANTNQIQTRNEGEESSLQVSNSEKENLGGLVSQKVQDLLEDETLEKGIGLQVKQFVQEQKQTQERVQEKLIEALGRNKITKSLIGPDYKTLRTANEQLEGNQIRIQSLEELKLKLTNQADITLVTQTIEALVAQNTSLQEQINLEEKQFGLFGWLFKFLSK